MKIREKTFFIKGMHCASCVYISEKALKSIPGVKKAVVNLANNQAKVELEREVSEKELSQAIEKIGYQAVFPKTEEDEDWHKKEKDKELKQLKKKSLISLVVAGLIIWGSFPGLMGFAPTLLKNFYFQFILASLVQFVMGWQFYQATIPALKNRQANMDTLVTIGTSVAYFYSTMIIFFPRFFKGHLEELMPYFDVSSTIIALILFGRYLETKAKNKTSEAIKKLMGLQPKEATIIVKG